MLEGERKEREGNGKGEGKGWKRRKIRGGGGKKGRKIIRGWNSRALTVEDRRKMKDVWRRGEEG